MADGHHFEKSKIAVYLSNSSTNHRKIWRGDDIAAMNFAMPANALDLLFYVIKQQRILGKKQNGFSFSSL